MNAAAAAPDADLPEGWLRVESMNIEGQGVARRSDGKVVFIDGALAGEVVSAQVFRRKNQWEAATLTAIHRASSQRVPPRCPYFGLHQGACGGCKMQHLDAAAQVAVKQRALEDSLWHVGKTRPDLVLRPIAGADWHYRARARLSVRYVQKKGEALVGFHERKSRYVADMRQCPVLPAPVSALLAPLRELIGRLDARETCPQIELACGDAVTALVLRHLQPLSPHDEQALRDFGARHGVQWWLQAHGPDSARLLDAGGPELSYALPEWGVRLFFRPTDFTQVNPPVNRALVSRALRLLDAQPHERVIDWFCGLGNFTLPMATRAARVLGVEGSAALIARARSNVERNRAAAAAAGRALGDVQWAVRDLFEIGPEQLALDGSAERWLIDPPREGAFALVKALAALRQRPPGELAGWQPPRRIVYVSCDPATPARHAGLLVHQAGYRCAAAGVVNMFPHTAHVESMAVFDLGLGVERGTLNAEPRAPPPSVPKTARPAMM
jgi:23S rRNA (uracil1939-C5)-methyltransferase